MIRKTNMPYSSLELSTDQSPQIRRRDKKILTKFKITKLITKKNQAKRLKVDHEDLSSMLRMFMNEMK
jgi:hypothetical protein